MAADEITIGNIYKEGNEGDWSVGAFLAADVLEETKKFRLDLFAKTSSLRNETIRAMYEEARLESLFTGNVDETVREWLDEHPEATTTVEDGSLTYAKLVVGTLGFVTPQMFGAKGDGVTDDTAALKACVSSGVKEILFPKATYLVDVANFDRELKEDGTTYYSTRLGIRVPSGVHINGCGSTILVKQTTISNLSAIICTDNYRAASYEDRLDWESNITIENLIIDGNSENLGNTKSLTGIAVNKTKNVIVRNVVMKNLCGTDGEGYGIIFAFSENCIFENSIIDRSSRSNIYCWESKRVACRNLNLYGSYYRDCATCGSDTPVVYQESEISFLNCYMHHEYNTGTHVLRFSGSVKGRVDRCRVVGNSGIDGIVATRSSSNIIDLVIRDSSVESAKVGFDSSGQNSFTRIVLENNRFEGSNAANFSSCQELVLRGNYFKNTDSSKYIGVNAEKFVADANIFDSCDHVTATCSVDSKIVSNYFKDFAASANWLICSGNAPIYLAGNTSTNSAKKARIYSVGKAVANGLTMDSTTLTVDQFNG